MNNIIKNYEHQLSIELINPFPSYSQEGGRKKYSRPPGRHFCDSKAIGGMPR